MIHCLWVKRYKRIFYKGIKNKSVKITLKKQNNDNEFEPEKVYINSSEKTVINRRYYLNESFEEILNKLGNGLMKAQDG